MLEQAFYHASTVVALIVNLLLTYIRRFLSLSMFFGGGEGEGGGGEGDRWGVI